MMKPTCEIISQEDFVDNIKNLYDDILGEIEDSGTVDLIIRQVYKAGFADGLKLASWLSE